MSSIMRVLPGPSSYYVAVTCAGTDVSAWTLNETTGVFTSSNIQPVEADGGVRTVYRDLGEIVFYTASAYNGGVNPKCANVDVKRVVPLTTSGPDSANVIYIPLGTRAKAPMSEQTNIPSCWVTLLSANVAYGFGMSA